MSCFVNTLLQKRGFDAMDNVWEGRQPHRMRLLDAEASMTNSIYERLQPVAAGLVDRPEDMPGFVFDWSMWRPGRIVKVDAPENVYFDMRYREKTCELNFVANPLPLSLFNWNVERLIYWMRKLEHLGNRRILRERNWRCRGAQAVLNIHPFDEPRKRRATRGGTVPSFRIGARGIIGRETRIVSSMETTCFREEHRQASRDFRNGDRERVFPYGTDKMARLYGVRVESEPKPDAILIAPGNSAEELRDEARRNESGLSEDARRVITNVKNAIDAEAPFFSEYSDASHFVVPSSWGRRGTRPVRPGSNSAPDDSPDVHIKDEGSEGLPPAVDEVEVQTLRGRRNTSLDKPPRRIVVLRTRHKTKRPGPVSGRRADDEPAD